MRGEQPGVRDEQDHDGRALQCARYVGCEADCQVVPQQVAEEEAVWDWVQFGGEYVDERT